MDLKLNEKTALVSAGTAGIGLEIARKLAVEGADVVITGRSQAKLDAAIDSIRASGGTSIQGIAADVATAEGAATVARAVTLVDILINNLGVYESKPFGDISDDDWRRFFDVNVLSGARLARTYFPDMLKRNWGRVIFIASESGVMIPKDMIHYGMTKSAQISMSRGMAELTKGTAVTVNAVLPGPTRSEGIIDFLKSMSTHPAASERELETEFFAKHRATSLIQRMLEAEEIANMVAFLASPLGSATNGAAVRVEGGLVPTAA